MKNFWINHTTNSFSITAVSIFRIIQDLCLSFIFDIDCEPLTDSSTFINDNLTVCYCVDVFGFCAY